MKELNFQVENEKKSHNLAKMLIVPIETDDQLYFDKGPWPIPKTSFKTFLCACKQSESSVWLVQYLADWTDG